MVMSLRLFIAVLVCFVNCVCCDDVFTNSFCNIRFKPTFVDKTALIPEVLKHKYLMLQAPSKFGKSTNIGMLNMFLSNLRTPETIEEFFNGTEVCRDEGFLQEHLGAHPVILYNASVCRLVHDEDHMEAARQYTIHLSFADHAYLVRSNMLSREEVQLVRSYLDVRQAQCLGGTSALRLLAQLLHRHHGLPVILLVDGLGSGILERILDDNEDFSYLRDVTVQWYSALINDTLRDQRVISHAFVTGETSLFGMQPIFTRVGFMEDSLLSHFYGFTYDELESLLIRFHVPLDRRPGVLKWYCGYSTADGKVKVCNPHSLLLFLGSHHRDLRVYWYGSPTGSDLLQRMVVVHSHTSRLVALALGHSVNTTLDADITEAVAGLRRKVEQLKPDSDSFIFQVLIEVGYLTHTSHPPPGTATLKFPNEEVRSVINKFISLLSFI